MAKCLQCGVVMSLRASAKFCSKKCCQRYHYIKRRGSVPTCIICGNELSGNQKKYCSAKCQKTGSNFKLSEKRKEDFDDYKSYKNIKPKKRTKPKMSLDEVMKRARVEGLPYGQFVAKYNLD